MDPHRFDDLVATAAASRRGIVAAAGGAALAALGLRREAAACRKGGAPCDPGRADACCSGTCRKVGRRFRCRPAKGAFGCTNLARTDACEQPPEDVDGVRCPGNPNGFCAVDHRGRPYCVSDGICATCKSDADCRLAFDIPGLRCIKQCRACNGQSGGRACIRPATPDQPAPTAARPPFR